MEDPGGLILDETHCFLALCQHPCCWEAERRVYRGFPRYTKARTAPTVSQEEGLPTLKVLNIPMWRGAEEALGLLPGSSGLINGSALLLSSLSPGHVKDSSAFTESMENIHFPGLNSPRTPGCQRRKDRTRSTAFPTAKDAKDIKLSRIQFDSAHCGSGYSCGTGSIMVWLPSPQHSLHSSTCHRAQSPHISIKEVTCSLPPLKTSTALKTKRKKRPDIKTVLPPPPNPVQLHPGEDVEADRPQVDGEGCSDQSEDPNPTSPPRENSAPFRNKPVVFHCVKERSLERERRLKKDHSLDPSGPQYKLDNNKEGKRTVDWDCLRNQPYLWKKHAKAASQGTAKTTAPEPIPLKVHPPQPWTDFGFYPTPRATARTLHCGPDCALAVGPAQRHCPRCAAGSWHSGCSTKASLPAEEAAPAESRGSRPLLPLSTAHQPQGPRQQAKDDKSSSSWIQENRGTIPPFNSMLCIQDPGQQHRLESEETAAASEADPGADVGAGGAGKEVDGGAEEGCGSSVHSEPIPLPPPPTPRCTQDFPDLTPTPGQPPENRRHSGKAGGQSSENEGSLSETV
nr:PREDICTED: uncharacterized protein C9orf43 homolog isoform X2 [Lepisosteus oculatus]